MKRLLDLLLLLIAGPLLFLPMVLIALLVRLTSKGPAIHWSKRIGRHNTRFLMPKFRTMYVDTPQVATHLLQDSQSHITPLGKFLRKTSLDELPQLISIFTGKMSFVGPRPALFNQDDLEQLRTEKGVQVLRPGVTGWAQINGRDDIPIPQKVDLDAHYLEHRSCLFDLKIICLTFVRVIRKEGVQH